MRGRTCMQ